VLHRPVECTGRKRTPYCFGRLTIAFSRRSQRTKAAGDCRLQHTVRQHGQFFVADAIEAGNLNSMTPSFRNASLPSMIAR